MPWNAPPEQPIASQPIPVERLLTTRQVAAILNVEVETLKKWRRRGIGQCFSNWIEGQSVTDLRQFKST
jgi:hypothetical protein